MTDPLKWITGVYAPHFLELAGFPEHAETLRKHASVDFGALEPHVGWADNVRAVLRDIAEQHAKIVAAARLRWPDDDPARYASTGSQKYSDIWTVADRAGDIAIVKGAITPEERQQKRIELWAAYTAS